MAKKTSSYGMVCGKSHILISIIVNFLNFFLTPFNQSINFDQSILINFNQIQSINQSINNRLVLLIILHQKFLGTKVMVLNVIGGRLDGNLLVLFY